MSLVINNDGELYKTKLKRVVVHLRPTEPWIKIPLNQRVNYEGKNFKLQSPPGTTVDWIFFRPLELHVNATRMGGYDHSYRPRFPPNKSVYPTAAPRCLWELGSYSEGTQVPIYTVIARCEWKWRFFDLISY